MSSNQRKQLMTKGFLYCAVVLVLAMCGTVPATAQFPPSPPSCAQTEKVCRQAPAKLLEDILNRLLQEKRT
jgi:hypothetical protein